jgi:methionyl-tRNA formyltransferase
MKKKVGILINSTRVSKQINDLLQLSLESSNYEITTLIVNNLDNNNGNMISNIFSQINRRGLLKFLSITVFKIICKIESFAVKRLSKFSAFYDKYELFENQYEVINVKPLVSKSGFEYRYEKLDIEKIKNANLDLLIRAGSGILKGEILTVCPNGIISFHHGDNDTNRGGPPGFWEVYERKPRTGFIIQRLKEELDGGDVLYKGFIATSWYYSLNLTKLYEISNQFFYRVIDDVTSDKPSLSVQKKSPYSNPLYKVPSLFQSTVYLIKTTKIFLEKIFREVSGKNYQWSVAYQFVDSWQDVALWRSTKIPNPQNRFLADPFVIYRNGEHYCFVEDYDHTIKRGGISVYKITSGSNEELGSALIEDFHLSYPYLFEFEGELYMCPETSEKREIRIYKCVDFPLKWVFHKTVMRDISAADTAIFPYGDKWWIFTNLDKSLVKDYGSQLHIFYGTDPFTENWTPHYKNPVIFDSLKARNGGLIIEEDAIYRTYQRQGFNIYGEGVGVAKINTLTTSEYSEEVIFEAVPRFFKNLKGTHTYNFHRGLLVFDYCEITKIKNGLKTPKLD